MPLNKGEVYSSRTEIEESLPNDSFETIREVKNYNKILTYN